MLLKNNKMARNTDNDSPSVNLIGNGTVIKGSIQSDGDIRIDGTLIGSIVSKGKVVVGPSGNVEGDIACNDADISGNLKVKITVSEVLLLKPSAKLSGDIITNKLAIESGATFSGTCSMGAVVKDISNTTNQEKHNGGNADMNTTVEEKIA
jgi:cytoskeletal protein CcmA (bactofilin family)